MDILLEIQSFPQEFPEVLSFPPSYFSDVHEQTGRKLRVTSILDLQILSRSIQGDLDISYPTTLERDIKKWTEEDQKLVDSLIEFFMARSLLYSNNLTGLEILLREGTITLRYKEETLLLLLSRGTFEYEGILRILQTLPIRDFGLKVVEVQYVIDFPLSIPILGLYGQILAEKGLETLRLISDETFGLLEFVLPTETRGRPLTIQTLMFKDFSVEDFLSQTVPRSFPGIQRLDGVNLQRGRSWGRFLSLFPDLRSLRYEGTVSPGEIQQLYPSLETTRY